MQYVARTSIHATAATVWSIIADLPRWPSWTPTFENIGPIDARPELGRVIVVKQPGRRTAEWTVDRVVPGRSFRWSTSSLGTRIWADHEIVSQSRSGCVVELSFSMSGWLGRPLSRLGASMIRRMVDTEAAGLKTRAEGNGDPTDRPDVHIVG